MMILYGGCYINVGSLIHNGIISLGMHTLVIMIIILLLLLLLLLIFDRYGLFSLNTECIFSFPQVFSPLFNKLMNPYKSITHFL